jgi:hypothetical protein
LAAGLKSPPNSGESEENPVESNDPFDHNPMSNPVFTLDDLGQAPQKSEIKIQPIRIPVNASSSF